MYRINGQHCDDDRWSGSKRSCFHWRQLNYFAKYLSGYWKAALEEKKRHETALEDYQAAVAKYTRDRTMLLDWIETNREIKEQAKQNITNTDYAFKL